MSVSKFDNDRFAAESDRPRSGQQQTRREFRSWGLRQKPTAWPSRRGSEAAMALHFGVSHAPNELTRAEVLV